MMKSISPGASGRLSGVCSDNSSGTRRYDPYVSGRGSSARVLDIHPPSVSLERLHVTPCGGSELDDAVRVVGVQLLHDGVGDIVDGYTCDGGSFRCAMMGVSVETHRNPETVHRLLQS